MPGQQRVKRRLRRSAPRGLSREPEAPSSHSDPLKQEDGDGRRELRARLAPCPGGCGGGRVRGGGNRAGGRAGGHGDSVDVARAGEPWVNPASEGTPEPGRFLEPGPSRWPCRGVSLLGMCLP